jgi:hypothetical protein
MRLYFWIRWRSSVSLRELRRYIKGKSGNHSWSSRSHENALTKQLFQICGRDDTLFVNHTELFQKAWFWGRNMEAMRQTWADAFLKGIPNWCGISSAWMSAPGTISWGRDASLVAIAVQGGPSHSTIKWMRRTPWSEFRPDRSQWTEKVNYQ